MRKLPPEETRFKPGVSGNPSGRAKVDPVVKAFRETTYLQFIEALHKYGLMNREEIQADLKRPDATMFELMFGNIVASAAKGDKDARALLIERLWGKVKEDVSLNSSTTINVTKENLKELYAIAAG